MGPLVEDTGIPRLLPDVALPGSVKGMAAPPLHRPKKLLDLPLDILKEIIKKLTHTNDLTSVALVHSALHRLATPHIYSRFDIVWPDGASSGEPRGGVDALTYGLATLTMAEDVYGEAVWQREKQRLTGDPVTERQVRRRRGNYYAQFIRKFSLGNGPAEWVEDYLTNKEQGKMLGTLVALALARMKSLESFVWDMPTGILNDVWTSLSYLGDRGEGEACRLEKVWIRWHRNDLLLSNPPRTQQGTAAVPRVVDQANALSRVEHPSFSILSPLRSLSVVEVDELQYLDEMSVLIGDSLAKLRELRVGISALCRYDDWVQPYDDDKLEQIDYSNPVRSTIKLGGKRRGGVLGVLFSSFLDLKQKHPQKGIPPTLRRRSAALPLLQAASQASDPIASLPPIEVGQLSLQMDATPELQRELQEDVPLEGQRGVQEPASAEGQRDVQEEVGFKGDIQDGVQEDVSGVDIVTPPAVAEVEVAQMPPKMVPGTTSSVPILMKRASDASIPEMDTPPLRLNLEVLELEYTPIHIPALTVAVDWTRLTSLTLLDCPNSDGLWSALIENFSRQAISAHNSSPFRLGRRKPSTSYAYQLQLKVLHINNVTNSFLNFTNTCLASNSLEAAYLQDFSGDNPAVDIERIFNTIVKRHRSSLRRLVIDSCKRKKHRDGTITRSAIWKKWALTTDHIRFITSGKMPQLRELGFCIEYSRAWHYFVQHLPGIPHLRSLYIPRYSAQYDPPAPAPKELAMHLLDAVVFNPQIELCYLGIYDKCYEVLEGDPDLHDRDGQGGSSSRGGLDDSSEEEDDEDDDDDDEEDDDNVAHDDGVPDGDRAQSDVAQYSPSEDEDGDSVDDGSDVGSRLHIREILFYDDKVPIFRVRHGRL